MSIESCQTQTHIYIDSPSIYDVFNDKVLEILSNLHPTLVKDFLSHLEMRMHRMISPLTRSDRFLLDRLTTSIHTLPYPEHPVYVFMSCLSMNQNMNSCAQDSMVVSSLRITRMTPT